MGRSAPSAAARFVSVRRFADLVGLSERTIWRLVSRNELPVLRIGRRTLISVMQGIAALENGTPISSSTTPDTSTRPCNGPGE